MCGKTDFILERAAPPDSRESLSTRSLEVLERASRGLTDIEIAAERNLAIDEVKRCHPAVYHKLGVSNRTAAVNTNLREMGDIALVQREG